MSSRIHRNVGDGASPIADAKSMKEAVKVLYPRSRLDIWNEIDPAGGSDVLASLDSSRHHHHNSGRHRFSRLLLEHGEVVLQDWAVVASSVSAPAVVGGGRVPGGPRRLLRKGSSSLNGPIGLSGVAVVPPSGSMGSIPGRLRLCSRSVVFEPDDGSRGIVRCPFRFMESHPFASPSSEAGIVEGAGGRGGPPSARKLAAAGGGGDADESSKPTAAVATVQSNRHLVMKANNIISPFDSVEVPVEFRFTFLHSMPGEFFELSKTLFDMVNARKTGKTDLSHPSAIASALEQIMQPMLDRPFDPANFVDIREVPLTSNLRASLLTPLLSNPGCAIVTKERIYFQPAAGVLSPSASRAVSWNQSDIVAIARRYHGLRDSSLEIYVRCGSSVLLGFEDSRVRERVIRLLPRNIPCHTDRSFVVKAFQEWKLGNISNFEYLLVLNSSAGRTFHDLSRYPVFPWVIADYESSKLDLTKHETFRDLTKPVGALNEERLEYFKSRLGSMVDMGDPFLYGTHYSAPGYVLFYLVRNFPEHMLCLQNGKFDAPDRMFHSISQCYASALINHADVKELIPEFYDATGAGFDFLINARSLQLGIMQSGDRVHDVQLPPWAKSPRDFLKKNRKALESDICTRMLPRWIDLIFGDKSRGDAAMEASNLFHRMAYMGPKDLDAMESDDERMQAELQATEFGIVPDQLFGKPHPLRTDSQSDENEFMVPDSGRSIMFEGDDDTDDDLDSAKRDGMSSRVHHHDQAWELLDRPLNSQDSDIVDGGRMIEKTWSGESATSAKESAFSVALSPSTSGIGRASKGSIADNKDKSLATPAGKAKASWLSNFNPSVPSGDLDTGQDNDGMTPLSNSSKSNGGSGGVGYLGGVGGEGEKLDSGRGKDRFGNDRSKNLSVSPMSSRKTLSLSGSGDLARSKKRQDAGANRMSTLVGGALSPDGAHRGLSSPNNDSSDTQLNSTLQPEPLSRSRQQGNWDLKSVGSKMMHGDSVSGCHLFVNGSAASQNQSYLTTVSLDGGLMVHTLPSTAQQGGKDKGPKQRRSFTAARVSTLGRLPYIGARAEDKAPSSLPSQGKLNVFRSHTSADPLACLVVTTDDHGGLVAFAGGHDDVVLAYGINSACALASVYSHRDAVTGIDLICRPSFGGSRHPGSSLPTLPGKSTRIMVSGSWDATVKVWSVTIEEGETVSINREPLAELFDADSSIVCVAATEVHGKGVAIGAGCADGSFVVWLCSDDGGKEVVHKEFSKRGSGPCSVLKWSVSPELGTSYLFAGFSTGKIASYSLKGGILRPRSKVSVGVPVQCLDISENMLLIGCADGGLRLVNFSDEACFDAHPILWRSVNGKTSPGICSISVAVTYEENNLRRLCSTGAEDGSVSLFELKLMT